MRLPTRRERIIACFSLAIMCFIVIGLLVMRSKPITLEDSFGDIRVRFMSERSHVTLPNDCTIISWRVEGATQIHLDDQVVEPVGYSEFCPTSSQMPVLKVDYSVIMSREYRLPIMVMVYQMDFIVLLMLMVTSLAVGVGMLVGGKIAILQMMMGGWFVVWALDFIINRTTFRLFDGNRYFALFDDAMISMRYAWNFVNGHGLVWNVGERVEGYSNLLMVVVMMPANYLFSKGMAVLVMHLFGLMMLLLIAYLTAKIATRLFLSESDTHQSAQKVLFFVVALSYYPLVYWSLMGMETGLLTVMMLFTLWAMLNDKPYQMAVFAGLAYLTRQDGLLLVLPILVYWAYQHGYFKRIVIFSLILFALFPIGQQIFRVLYYGEWLPNTYIMKVSGIPLAHRLMDGMEYALLFISSVALVLIVNGAGMIRRPDDKKLLIASIFVLLIAYQIYVGGDAWLYWRMFSPIMPLMLAWLVHEVVAFTSPYATRYSGVLVGLIVVCVLVIGPNQRFMPEIIRKVAPYDVGLAEPLLKSAVALNHLVMEDAEVGVVMAGILPYYTGLYAIDYLGKSDPVIAHLPPDLSGSVAWLGRTNVPGHIKYNLYYSLQQRHPDFTQRCSWGYQNLCPFAEQYYRRVTYYDHEIWLRRGSPHVRWELIDPDMGLATQNALPQLDGAINPLTYQLENGLYISGVAMTDMLYQGGLFNVGLMISSVTTAQQDIYIMAYEWVDERGETVFVSETNRLIYHYTTADLQADWTLGTQHEIRTPYDIETGYYQLYLSFYNPFTLERQQVMDENGHLIGDRMLLGQIQIITVD